MAIDDPISALEALNLSDDRQRSPISRFSRPFLAIAKLLPLPDVQGALGALNIAADLLNLRAESNQQQLVEVFTAEFKFLREKFKKILLDNKEQRQFIENEMPGLALDALRRAEECRARERIARLARILCHAAEVGATDGADLVEQMMVVATGLSELDVLILRHAALEYRSEISTHSREAQRAVAKRAWLRVPEKAKCKISGDQLVSTGSKLESFGLVTRVETGEPWEPSVFRPLDFGYRFIDYVQSLAELDAAS